MYKSVLYIGVRGWYCSCLIGVTHCGFDVNFTEVIYLSITRLSQTCELLDHSRNGTPARLDVLCELTTPIRHPHKHTEVLPTFGSLSPYTTLDYQIRFHVSRRLDAI